MTLRYVPCGRAIGARTVAVATGQHDLWELEAAGPWLTLPRLPSPERFAELLGLRPERDEGSAGHRNVSRLATWS